MAVKIVRITVTASGSAGSATGSGTTESINGRICAIHLDHSTGAATTDTTIKENSVPNQTILAKADSVTDAWFYPRAKVQDVAGVAAAAGDNLWDYFRVSGPINVALAQADDAQTVTATIVYESFA